MPKSQLTKSATEADFEARIDASIRLAFPLLPANAIRHQTKFSFWLGGKEITIDGKSKDSAQARADIIVYFHDRPLAVLELKRIGLALSDEDSNQGLSYARVLNPSPPLVVVSNGQEVRFIETHSGQLWQPAERSEEMLAGLVQTAARVAADDLKSAVSTLMATSPDVWIQAVRKTTVARIAELSGGWSNRLLPFVQGFQLPRKATTLVRDLLKKGSRLVIVEGAPLAGKSNILRELAESTEQDPSLVVLFIESGGPTSVLQQVADTLSQELDWPISKEEARTWLKHLSNTKGPQLVVALDGIGLNLAATREEIVDLTSHTFGSALALVIELDDTNADAAVLDSTGRRASAIGRRASRVPVKPLDAEEFESARESLWNHRFGMTNGAQSSQELRLPWVLRAIGSHLVSQPEHSDPNLIGGFPPLLSMDLIRLARESFSDEIRGAFQAIATAALEDAEDAKRPISLMLESMSAYVVRRKTLKKHLSELELARLVEQGFLKPILHRSGGDVLVARIPELVASEASAALARQLGERARQSGENAARWLCMLAANLPLGDIVAAYALVDAAMQDQGIPFNVITTLLERPPRKEQVKVGSRLAMYLPGLGTLDVTVRSDGLSAKTPGGREHFFHFDPEDVPNATYADIHAWLILSHLAGIPFAVGKEGEDDGMERVDAALLMEVGKCPITLRRASVDIDMGAILTHEVQNHGSIVCYESGIVEPITLSLVRFLGRESGKAEGWIQTAVSSGSLFLLARLDIALRELSEVADEETSAFAKEVLARSVRPAFTALFPVH